jgi:hypothetical protein
MRSGQGRRGSETNLQSTVNLEDENSAKSLSNTEKPKPLGRSREQQETEA